jgi:UDP-hydrolysing UDP-N-acetyl-D-glucosamine 2-epimerase
MMALDSAIGGSRRTIAVVTGSRADYGLNRPVLRAVANAPDLKLRLMVCGTHLSPGYGLTVRRIEQDGFPIADRIEMLGASDTPEGIGESIARGVLGFARAFALGRPDLLLLLGDRYEMLAAATAALPFALPIAHIHGGELTEGVIDDAIRHSLTKMSHLHFVSTERYRERVIQMGEQPARVIVTGAPGLDTIEMTQPTGLEKLARRLDMSFDPRPLLVTFHPVTLEYAEVATQTTELLTALAKVERPILFTYPNADTSGSIVVAAVDGFVAGHPNARLVKDLGAADYFGMLAVAAAMVGNSSSGLIEAPSFHLPVVNIGSRQRGRIRARNVIDCEAESDAIVAAIERATSPSFRASLVGLDNPYGDGRAAGRIVAALRSMVLDGDLIKKRFFDLPNLDEPLRQSRACR